MQNISTTTLKLTTPNINNKTPICFRISTTYRLWSCLAVLISVSWIGYIPQLSCSVAKACHRPRICAKASSTSTPGRSLIWIWSARKPSSSGCKDFCNCCIGKWNSYNRNDGYIFSIFTFKYAIFFTNVRSYDNFSNYSFTM